MSDTVPATFDVWCIVDWVA